METPSTPPPSQTKKVHAAAPLTKRAKDEVMQKIQAAKVKDVSYMEFVNGGTTVWPPPSSPPYTTWNGLMLCPPSSPYAKRLIQQCGGIPIAENGTESKSSATAVIAAGAAVVAAGAAVMAARQAVEDASKGAAKGATNDAEKDAAKVDMAQTALLKAEMAVKSAREQLDKTGAPAVLGFWTAPEDWREMLEEMRKERATTD